MVEFKDYYFIFGKTRSDRYVSVSAFSTQKECIQAFRTKYPRFSGLAMLYKETCEVSDGVLQIDVFKQSRKRHNILEFTKNLELQRFVAENVK